MPTATAGYKVDISANSLTIDSTSKVDVASRGFLGGKQPGNPFGRYGMTLGFQSGSTGTSGGSYGGLGGASEGSPNPTYGDLRNPNEVGSGGATSTHPSGLGGNGGGLVRISAGTFQLDGSILANGAGGIYEGAGGSGGGIRLEVGTLRGAGLIAANGGNGIYGSGGGGGRIAIYYQDLSGFNLSRVTAVGGYGGGGRPGGQNGSILVERTFAMLPPDSIETRITKNENDPPGQLGEKMTARKAAKDAKVTEGFFALSVRSTSLTTCLAR
ncbi:MAG: hypothetical protein HY695_01790 [Deltaproteobacteria bacterium]|nr:hypothetical protein [Deltaproteobacteria bacterium]